MTNLLTLLIIGPSDVIKDLLNNNLFKIILINYNIPYLGVATISRRVLKRWPSSIFVGDCMCNFMLTYYIWEGSKVY